MNQNNYYTQSSMYTQTPQPQPNVNAEVSSFVDSAFGKGLAATIMAWFPICSIISIILGSKGLSLVKRAREVAAYYGISAGGKSIAAKILSMIGKIGGIVMTCFWTFYFVLIFAIVATAF